MTKEIDYRKYKREKVYSALAIANLCGVSYPTVVKWIKKGLFGNNVFKLPSGQYRVQEEDVKKFVESRGLEFKKGC